MEYEKLSKEQQQFIQYAIDGQNILVDACIGSGKTMAIQTLCTYARSKRVLYLTYNKLLKLDAQDRIRNGYVTVTNYHGFAYSELRKNGISCGLSELIQTYNRQKPVCMAYNVLILDEYQDIEQEIAEMLWHIKDCCPGIQLIAVGDMSQKIYDKTRLDVQDFITSFLGNYVPMEFTNCFRIGKDHAAMLGRVWGKEIVGVNSDFQMKTMYEYEIREFVSELNPSQLLVLGSKNGKAQEFQNSLEKWIPDKFNKRTLWSKIKEGEGATNPTPDCAIFTTYDGCKGMEREVCVLFDWSVMYWEARLSKPDTRYEIIRNVFCVAASRAKKLLIIARNDNPITEETLSDPSCANMPFADMEMSEMFDYKFVEDVEDAYHQLHVEEIQPVGEEIEVALNDELIDLSPCIEHYIETMYFTNYNIDDTLEYYLSQYDKSHMRRAYKKYTLDQKLLYLAALETKQQRYMNQVKSLPISKENRNRIWMRLSKKFPRDARVQTGCGIEFYSEKTQLFQAKGRTDVLHENILYELKFVGTVSHVHILQLAMYLAATGYRTGRLWNVRTDQMLEVQIPDRQAFLDCVAIAVTKGRLDHYEEPKEKQCRNFFLQHPELCQQFLTAAREMGTCSSVWVEGWFEEHGRALPVKGNRIGRFLVEQEKSGRLYL